MLAVQRTSTVFCELFGDSFVVRCLLGLALYRGGNLKTITLRLKDKVFKVIVSSSLRSCFCQSGCKTKKGKKAIVRITANVFTIY